MCHCPLCIKLERLSSGKGQIEGGFGGVSGNSSYRSKHLHCVFKHSVVLRATFESFLLNDVGGGLLHFWSLLQVLSQGLINQGCHH